MAAAPTAAPPTLLTGWNTIALAADTPTHP
jgi:hypothetical protein